MASLILEVIFTLLFNGLPLIIIAIPWFFIRKRAIGKLYLRIIVGIIVFYLIYWVLPFIFQLGPENSPDELALGINGETISLAYIPIHFMTLVMQFIQYPLISLPFIFFLAPFITFIMVLNRLRKEEGSISENLSKLSYEYKSGLFQQIKSQLLKSDWKREKEMLKIIVVLLPISLYLLQVILKITGLEAYSLEGSTTALGWFLEILFAYLAVFIFSIELLASSKIALKGRSFGKNVREQTYRSLFIVGLPISLLSVVLFLVDNLESIDIIFYFFSYSVMGSIIFILFLRIFEPISILILIKLIDWWKKKKEYFKKIDKTSIYYGFIFGLIAIFIYLFIVYFGFGFLFTLLFQNDAYKDYLINNSLFSSTNPSLLNSASLDLMLLLNAISSNLLPIIITPIFLFYCFRYTKSISSGALSFFFVIIVFSILFGLIGMYPLINFAPEEYWVNGKVSFTYLFNIQYFTLRTALFNANLEGILGILAIPYLYSRYIFSILIWSLIIYYIRKKIMIKNIPIEGKVMEKIFYSDMKDYVTTEEYNEDRNRFLISKYQKESNTGLEHVREEVIKLLQEIQENKLLTSLKTSNPKENERLYYTLKYLYKNKLIELWVPEFSYNFETVEKQSLYIIYDDGRGVFDFKFSKDSEGEQDAGLISGMFSAITSFVKEATKSSEALQKIDHGDITILIEYGENIFGALFVKGNETSEVRNQLRKFVHVFEEKHKDTLTDWSGSLSPFEDSDTLIDEIFKE
ncbi:MAG: hypothetical protein P8Y70_07860 [Candidatus Lokiarchaeota archaeon]